MKKYLYFVVRLSILNFCLLLLATVFINKYNLDTKEVKKTNLKNQPVLNQQTLKNTEKENAVNANKVQNITKQPEPTQETQNLFSELSAHNTVNDCWIVYGGHIYNITPFFGSHPGGDGIMLKYCGQDATSAFDTKEKSPPMPHSGNAVSLLSQYLIQ